MSMHIRSRAVVFAGIGVDVDWGVLLWIILQRHELNGPFKDGHTREVVSQGFTAVVVHFHSKGSLPSSLLHSIDRTTTPRKKVGDTLVLQLHAFSFSSHKKKSLQSTAVRASYSLQTFLFSCCYTHSARRATKIHRGLSPPLQRLL